MGNVVTNIHSIIAFSKQEEIPIPEAKSLSDRQIKILKKSWEIVFARVSKFLVVVKYTELIRYFIIGLKNLWGI